ncbi:recombinase family protein [Anaerocolumna sp. AGMB13025]|uniref:recombinase family protein n=1 Tax=Anaerocolumna sp. AGMB13025 TaxID=3039116 RepID=UPI00241FFE9E|nr:recombinase family protein [Anaerocolumna sp. AGMB13025]WFR59590.1 recombinase family protein [Anaerocolumna sp. AGMB13025]
MNIAIYSRKSKYSEKGESIDNQIQYCKDYAQIHLCDIADKNYILYEDEGYSAANTIRPQFQKLIKDIKNRRINLLLCYRLDRINRNVSDFSKTLDILDKYDVPFVSATENFDTGTPMGKAMIYIASVFAQLERETTAERVRDNMLALSHTGRWLGGLTPFGYHSEAILYMDADYKERQLYKLIPVEHELKTVQMLFYKYMETKSLSQVEQYCLANHLKTKKHCDFTKSSLSMILQNPTYCIADTAAYDYFQGLGCVMANTLTEFEGTHGVLCYNRTRHQTGRKQKKRPVSDWVIAIGKHNGIINGKDFVWVQNLLKENKSKGSPRTETSNIALLSGKITCSLCGSKLRIKNIRKKENKIQFSYACEMKVLSKGTRCSSSNLSGDRLDQLLLDQAIGLLSPDSDFSYIPYLMQKEGYLKDNAINQDKILEELHEEETLLKNTIHTLLNQAVMNSSLSDNYILPKLNELDNKLTQVQQEITSLSVQNETGESPEELLVSRYENLTNISTLIHNSDIPLKKFLLNSLIDTINWDGKEVTVTLKTK